MNKLLFTQRGNRIIGLAIPLIAAFFALNVKLTGSLIPFLNAPPCVFKHFTGLDCPGCGGTRAAFALLYLDPASAFKYNPVISLMLIFGFIWYVWFMINAFRKKYKVPFESKRYPVILLTSAAVLLIFWILRNTAFYADFINQ